MKKIARVFFDTHMGKNFKGLLNICHKAGVKPEADTESYVVFINGKHTKFKLLVGNQYLVYHDNGERRFPLEAIQYLPSAFDGKNFEFSRAMENAIKEKIQK